MGPDEKAKRPISDGYEHLRATLVSDDAFDEITGPRPPDWARGNFLFASEDWLGTDTKPIMNPGNPAVIYVGSVREGLPGISNQESLEDYGDTAAEALAEPFSGSSTMRASLLLGKELWETEPDDLPQFARVTLMRAVELADACAQRICDEVIRDSESHNYIPGPDVRGWINHPHANPANIPILRLMGINTTDIRNFDVLDYWEKPARDAYNEDEESLPIYLGHLSSGTEGTLLWIRWLVLKIVHYYNFEATRREFDGLHFSDVGGWDKKPAILLIDEIENHLHPTWQRRVIPALLEHFPGLQIFATTHSPFVVAGLKAGQVHILERDANGVVTASTEQRDVIGWTADEILRGMMGVEEPTDQLTVDRANRLRELREKDELNEQEEEELNRLRRQVNEDLLNKRGPLEAQRERYADLVQDFLRMRQSELTQDGE